MNVNHQCKYPARVSLTAPQDQSAKEIADWLGVDEKTVRRWAGHEEYPCPHDRREGGKLYFSRYEVEAWLDRCGLEATPGRPTSSADYSAVDFWDRRIDYPPVPEFHDPHGMLPLIDCPANADHKARAEEPNIGEEDHDSETEFQRNRFVPLEDWPFLSPLERDVLAGRRTLSADEVKDLIAHGVSTRAHLSNALAWFPSWLVRQDKEEITARLRHLLFERFNYWLFRMELMADAQDGIERDDDGNVIANTKGKKNGTSHKRCKK